jgi:pimeloyl-ACP methyl ester carboxylesterase
VVLCYPAGEEYVRLHRAFRQMADDLAATGFPVLRFDYFACGDSEGDCETGTIEHWLGDISLAIAEIVRRSGLETTRLVGYRLGATLAMVAGADHPRVDAIALINPITRGGVYLDELREGHQRILRYSSVGGPARKSIHRQEEIMGFAYGRQLIDELQQLDLDQIQLANSKPILVVESREQTYTSRLRQGLESQGSSVTHHHLPRTELLTPTDRLQIEDVNHVEMPRELLQAAISWLTETQS